MTKKAYVQPHITVIQVEAENLMVTSPGEISSQSSTGEQIFDTVTDTEEGESYDPW